MSAPPDEVRGLEVFRQAFAEVSHAQWEAEGSLTFRHRGYFPEGPGYAVVVVADMSGIAFVDRDRAVRVRLHGDKREIPCRDRFVPKVLALFERDYPSLALTARDEHPPESRTE